MYLCGGNASLRFFFQCLDKKFCSLQKSKVSGWEIRANHHKLWWILYWQSVVCGAYYEFWSLISIFFLSNCRWSWLGQGNSVWQNLREIWIHSHVLGRFVAKRRSDFSMNLTHLHDLDCESWVMLENWSPPPVFNLTELRARLFLVAYNKELGLCLRTL